MTDFEDMPEVKRIYLALGLLDDPELDEITDGKAKLKDHVDMTTGKRKRPRSFDDNNAFKGVDLCPNKPDYGRICFGVMSTPLRSPLKVKKIKQ